MLLYVHIYLLIKISCDLNNADIITLTSQMRKLRLREAKCTAQGSIIAVTLLFKTPNGCPKVQIVQKTLHIVCFFLYTHTYEKV